MKNFDMLFVLVVSFFGILDAARIGSLVRFKSLSVKPEYNNRICLIEKFVNGRAKVWTFLDTLLSGPDESFELKPLKGYFFYSLSKIEKFKIIELKDWKSSVLEMTEQLENDPVLCQQILNGPLAKESIDQLNNFSRHLDEICAAYGDHQIEANRIKENENFSTINGKILDNSNLTIILRSLF